MITNADGTSDLQGADAPATLTAATLATAGAGTVGLTANGTFTFTPAAGFAGAAVHQLHDHRPGRRHLVLDGDGDGDGFCAEPGGSATNLTVDEDGFANAANDAQRRGLTRPTARSP